MAAALEPFKSAIHLIELRHPDRDKIIVAKTTAAVA
jgi:hypothetical protein